MGYVPPRPPTPPPDRVLRDTESDLRWIAFVAALLVVFLWWLRG